jgi:hypothetical protein
MMAIKVKRKNNLIILITLLLFTACSQRIKYRSTSERLIAPEANGKFLDGSFDIHSSSRTIAELNLENDSIKNPLEIENASYNIGMLLDVGIWEKMDFIAYAPANAGAVYGVKFQILGKNRMEAKKGDHSFSVYAGYGYTDHTEYNDDALELTATNDDVEANVIERTQDFALIYGYRMADDAVFYATFAFTQQFFETRLSSTDRPALDGENFEILNKAQTLAVGGIRYFDNTHVKLELSAQRMDWDNTDKQSFAYVNFAYGWQWN